MIGRGTPAARPTARRRRGAIAGIVAVVAGAALVLAGSPSASRGDEIALVPFAGVAWGGTQEFELAAYQGDVHIEAAPEYGFALAAYGHEYGAEVAYHAQFTDVVVRLDGLGELGSVEISSHYALLQFLRQFPGRRLTPFLSFGIGGAGLYAGGQNEWKLGLSLGAGARIPLPGRSSLRLHVRLLSPVTMVDNGFSFGAASRGIALGGREALYQGDASVGLAIPLWVRRR